MCSFFGMPVSLAGLRVLHTGTPSGWGHCCHHGPLSRVLLLTSCQPKYVCLFLIEEFSIHFSVGVTLSSQALCKPEPHSHLMWVPCVFISRQQCNTITACEHPALSTMLCLSSGPWVCLAGLVTRMCRKMPQIQMCFSPLPRRTQ